MWTVVVEEFEHEALVWNPARGITSFHEVTAIKVDQWETGSGSIFRTALISSPGFPIEAAAAAAAAAASHFES